MARVKPHQPRWQSGHPLARGHRGAWFFAQPGGDVRNLASRRADGVLGGAGAVYTTSAEGRAVGLDGASGIINCGDSVDVAGAVAFSAWARFILRTKKANGTYSAVLSQYNSPAPSDAGNQRFYLGQFNNVFGRPADCFEVTVLTSSGAYLSPNVTFAAGDVGRVVTLAGTYDGTTCRVHAMLAAGLSSASVSGAPGTVKVGSGTNTIWGRIDGGYLDCVALAGGILVGRVLTAADVAALHADPYGLIRPPARTAVGLPAAAVAPLASHLYRRRRAS